MNDHVTWMCSSHPQVDDITSLRHFSTAPFNGTLSGPLNGRIAMLKSKLSTTLLVRLRLIGSSERPPDSTSVR